MSEQHGLAPFQGPCLYVQDEGDDFTFYLDARTNSIKRDTDGAIRINGFRLEKPYFTLEMPTEHETNEGTKTKTQQFSFSGKVIVQDSGLAGGGLKGIDEQFWVRLRSESPDPPCEYLLNKIADHADGTDVIAKIRASGALVDEDKKKLLAMASAALNAVSLSDSEIQVWIEQYPLSLEENEFLSSLKEDERSEWQKRFLLKRAFPEFYRTGRGLICFSHGKYLSVTFRKLNNKGYEARHCNDKEARKTNLFSLGEYCDQIYKKVFRETESTRNAHGLLVVTGSTNSAKSEIARGLIHKYLMEPQSAKERKKHLVTFEDPIETLFEKEASWNVVTPEAPGDRFIAVHPPESASGVNYTPRQKERDVGLLKEALADALRQTPTVVFVGEIRDRKEWELLLDFAATGHLIVTTAHAGSLVEAMHNIFEARRVKTRAQRSEVAHKLLGVVHLKGDKIPFFNPLPVFATKLIEKGDLSTYLRSRMDSEPIEKCASRPQDENAFLTLVDQIENLVGGDSLYEKTRFEAITLSKETEALLREAPERQQLIRLNRMLLEDAYPDEMRGTTNVLFPALWRRTARGVAALTGDGLISLLPHRPKKGDKPSCVGRRWFVEKLLEIAKSDLAGLFKPDEKERITTRVYREATELDLRGE